MPYCDPGPRLLFDKPLRALSLALLLTAGMVWPVNFSTLNYANESTELETGARLAGCAGVSLGLPGDPSHMARSPAGLADVESPEVVVHHASLYEDLSLTQDEIYVAAPLTGGTLGLGVSRVGADGILRSERGETPDFNNPSTFSATDWIGTLAFARTWMDGHLRGGTSLRILGRQIDNTTGAGAQMDASLVWAQAGWRAGLRMDRGVGGVTLWNTGTAEYTAPNLEIGLGWEHPFPYFYGDLALAWESPGLLQAEGTSTFSEGDARPWKNPWLFVRASRVAMEFKTDFGLVLRTGCEIQAIVRVTDFLQGSDQRGLYGESSGEFAVGAGYLWSNRVRIDYAMVSSPDLGTTQRISLGLVFGGKTVRQVPANATRPAPSAIHHPEPVSDTIEKIQDDSVSTPGASAPAVAPAPASEVPVPSETRPAKPEAPAKSAPDDDAPPEQLAH